MERLVGTDRAGLLSTSRLIPRCERAVGNGSVHGITRSDRWRELAFRLLDKAR